MARAKASGYTERVNRVELSGGTLSIDIGGTGLKAAVVDPQGKLVNERVRVDTPRPATPAAVFEALGRIMAEQPAYERMSVGFPGVIVDGVVVTAPHLDGEWRGVALGAELERMSSRPVRTGNDADVHGLAVIAGAGVELVLTLGTGIGSALYTDGRLVPNLELGHHPFRKSRTYEGAIGLAAFEEVGVKKWNKRLRRVIAQLEPIFNYRVLYLGGGNARHIRGELPANVRIVDNVAGIIGGLRLWA